MGLDVYSSKPMSSGWMTINKATHSEKPQKRGLFKMLLSLRYFDYIEDEIWLDYLKALLRRMKFVYVGEILEDERLKLAITRLYAEGDHTDVLGRCLVRDQYDDPLCVEASLAMECISNVPKTGDEFFWVVETLKAMVSSRVFLCNADIISPALPFLDRTRVLFIPVLKEKFEVRFRLLMSELTIPEVGLLLARCVGSESSSCACSVVESIDSTAKPGVMRCCMKTLFEWKEEDLRKKGRSPLFLPPIMTKLSKYKECVEAVYKAGGLFEFLGYSRKCEEEVLQDITEDLRTGKLFFSTRGQENEESFSFCHRRHAFTFL
jgi:hypothetical protein